MKKLPIGRQTFSEVMETGYYVDKTNYIEMLTNIGTYFFLSRPRRFGKSTFLDTLKDAFEGKEKLFKGLYIGNRWDWSKKHPVIKISFGGGIMQSTEDVYNKIRGVLYFNQKHLDIQCHNTDPSNCLAELIQSSFEKYKEKVVLLIDEYDKPILDNIDNLEVALPVREILKGFYSVIKDSDEYIQFTFITGVSKFSKVNLFSGLNNLKDVTLDERFATICGYTHNELLDTFRNRLEGVPLDTLKSWYNGYNFLGEKVYNPFSLLRFFKDGGSFKNYWFETGTPTFLVKEMKRQAYYNIGETSATSTPLLHHT